MMTSGNIARDVVNLVVDGETGTYVVMCPDKRRAEAMFRTTVRALNEAAVPYRAQFGRRITTGDASKPNCEVYFHNAQQGEHVLEGMNIKGRLHGR